MFNEDFPSNIPKNEELFRKALEDLKINRKTIINGIHIPEDLETKLPIDELVKQYCRNTANGVFSIIDFDIEEEWDVTIMFSDQWWWTWWWAHLQYSINEEWELEFKETIMQMKT